MNGAMVYESKTWQMPPHSNVTCAVFCDLATSKYSHWLWWALGQKGKPNHSIYQQIWKTQQWPRDWKRSAFIPISKKGNVKECSNYCAIALISHASKVMFNILQARLQQYIIWELPDVQAEFRRGRETWDQIVNICGIIERAREFQKKHLLLLHWLS